jgi:quercetin dioxygenase-like cupin family protein
MPFLNIADIKSQEITPGYKARFVHSKNMTFAFWTIEPGMPLPAHSHMHEQVANVLSGEFELTVGNETKILSKGDVAIIPANVTHTGRALTQCEILDVFYPVREDYLG